jgi:hypothetical protein
MQATVGTALLPAMGELVQTLVPLVNQLMPRLIQLVQDAQPALRDLTQFLKDVGDETTTTGQTVGFLADSLGKFFSFASNNFGLLVQLAALFLAVRTAIALVTAALATTTAGWIIIGLGALATAMILVADAAKKVDDSVYKANVQILKTDPVKQALNPYSVYNGILGGIAKSSGEVSYQTKQMIESVERADKAKLENLRNQINGVGVSARYSANELRRMREAAGLPGVAATIDAGGGDGGAGGAGGAGAKKTPGGLPALIAASKKNAKVLKKELKLGGKGLSEEVAKWITSSNKPVKAANQALKRIAKNGEKAIKNLTKNYSNSAAGQQAAASAASEASREAAAAASEASREAAAAASEMARAQEDAARAEAEAFAERERIYNSFLDSVRSTFAGIKNSIMGAFDITGLGGSTNSVLRNMEKMLVRLRSFSTSLKQLATMGLDPALLQQIISMGPMAGARLAANLVAGGASGLGAINTGFREFGSLASQIATTGTNALFRTQAQQSVYNINVNGGVGSGATIGKAIVDAIKSYERTSGAVWQGA